jgi:hypothetical protein
MVILWKVKMTFITEPPKQVVVVLYIYHIPGFSELIDLKYRNCL